MYKWQYRTSHFSGAIKAFEGSNYGEWEFLAVAKRLFGERQKTFWRPPKGCVKVKSSCLLWFTHLFIKFSKPTGSVSILEAAYVITTSGNTLLAPFAASQHFI